MRELFTMWGNTRMVVLAALTAALYAAVLIPFKPIPIIPGFTELRPAVAIPLVFGYLFGPAAAWGSGIGNVIGDFFGGTLSLGSLFGFAGNFLLALVPSRLLGPPAAPAPGAPAWRLAVSLGGASVLASAACAAVIAWGVDLLGIIPFTALGAVILANNLLVGLALGPVLLRLMLPRVAAWHLLWTDILPAPSPSRARRRAGIALMWVGGLGALAAGFALSLGVGGGELFRFGVGSPSAAVAVGVPPFLLLLLLGLAIA